MRTAALAGPSRPVHLWLFLALVLCGCSSRSSLSELAPERLAGQIAPAYQMNPGRGVVLACFTVLTQGQPGFGAISNPLLVEFREAAEPGAWGTPDEHGQGLALPNPDALVWTTPSNMPTLWKYETPGLMAASIKPGTYDGLFIAYPDDTHSSMPDSIPAPSSGMMFTPVEIPAEAIVYIGNIQIRQHYSFWDRVLDRVDVVFSVTDDYEQTVADFRARYPQLRDTPIEKRLATVVAPVS